MPLAVYFRTLARKMFGFFGSASEATSAHVSPGEGKLSSSSSSSSSSSPSSSAAATAASPWPRSFEFPARGSPKMKFLADLLR